MKIRISDSFCEYEYQLSEEASYYSINEIIKNAIRKIPNKNKISIVSCKLIPDNKELLNE